jgi:hypothetical protein
MLPKTNFPNTPLKWNLVPRFDLITKRWVEELTVSRLQEARILSVEIILRLPRCFFLRVMTPLDLVHPYGLSSGLSLFLVVGAEYGPDTNQ